MLLTDKLKAVGITYCHRLLRKVDCGKYRLVLSSSAVTSRKQLWLQTQCTPFAFRALLISTASSHRESMTGRDRGWKRSRRYISQRHDKLNRNIILEQVTLWEENWNGEDISLIDSAWNVFLRKVRYEMAICSKVSRYWDTIMLFVRVIYGGSTIAEDVLGVRRGNKTYTSSHMWRTKIDYIFICTSAEQRSSSHIWGIRLCYQGAWLEREVGNI